MMAKQRICAVSGYAIVAILGVIAGYGIKAALSANATDVEIEESRSKYALVTMPSGAAASRAAPGHEDPAPQKCTAAELTRAERATLAMDWMFGANAAFADDSWLMAKAMRNWAEQDLVGASAWLSKNLDREGADFLIQGLVEVLAESDPEAALRWASECKSENQKLDASITGTYPLFIRNPDEAESLLDGSRLSAEAQETAKSELVEKVRKSSQRNAQNIVSVLGVALAAGAKMDTSSVESIIEQLTAGVNGSGNFENSQFKISKLDEVQQDLAKSFVVIQDDGEVGYNPSGSPR